MIKPTELETKVLECLRKAHPNAVAQSTLNELFGIDGYQDFVRLRQHGWIINCYVSAKFAREVGWKITTCGMAKAQAKPEPQLPKHNGSSWRYQVRNLLAKLVNDDSWRREATYLLVAMENND